MPMIQGKSVGPIGFGMMSLTMPGFPEDDEQAFAAIKVAIDCGCTYFNGGEFYGRPERNSLILMQRYLSRHPEDIDKVLLNVKGAIKPGLVSDGSPEYVRISAENCRSMLGPVGFIHQFEPARRDKNTPIEITVGALRDLVDEGKIGGVALSEVSAETIRKAAAVTKIAAVEVELSLWETAPLTNGIAKVCKELDIPIIAYGVLGHGLLGGNLDSLDKLPEKDYRRLFPRFQGEHFEKNKALVAEVKRLAEERGCTQAQLAIAWVLTVSRRPDMPVIVPIPGSSSVERIRQNAAAADVELSEADMERIDAIVKKFGVSGDRYHAKGMEMLDA